MDLFLYVKGFGIFAKGSGGKICLFKVCFHLFAPVPREFLRSASLAAMLMNRGVSYEVLLLAWHVEQPVKIHWKTSKCLQ